MRPLATLLMLVSLSVGTIAVIKTVEMIDRATQIVTE